MKKQALALALGAALVSGAASASNITVGGVTWDPASFDDYFMTDTMYEQVANFTTATPIVDADLTTNKFALSGTNTISGYGKLVNINGETNTTVFCAGCELTYQFGGFSLSQWLDVDQNASVNAGDHVSFSGGWAKFYVDFTPDFSNTSFASAGDAGGANALWLELAATSQTATYGAANLTGTLFSTLTVGSLGSGTEGGNGFGNFDAVGGLAMGNFDTNTQANGSDLRLTSQYNPRNCSPACPEGYNLTGGNTMAGNTIPEPGMLALMGAGLLGFGVSAARRRKVTG